MGYFVNSSSEAEESFYAAFEHLDLDLMRATWQQSDAVYCIHPGGPVQTGYETVLRHWSYILEGGQRTDIEYKLISAIEQGNVATHLVEEKIGTGQRQMTVLATNTYVREEQGWRLFSHHASLPPKEDSNSASKNKPKPALH